MAPGTSQVNVRVDRVLVDLVRAQLAKLHPDRPSPGSNAAVRWAIEHALDWFDERSAVRTRTVTTKCAGCGRESTWTETSEPARPPRDLVDLVADFVDENDA